MNNPIKKINIYGIGRSGTKAIQLWFAYLLAQKYETVWLNYEPFLFRTRTLEPTNRGQLMHKTIPLFIPEGIQVEREFQRFCRDLASHKVVVTKFIRANGRINAIDKLMQPDLSLLVVRDLYQVLESILLQDFCLVQNDYDWHRLCQQARELYPFLEDMGFLQKSTNKLIKTAVYWFVTNKYALDNLENTMVVDFKNYQSLGLLSAHLGLDSRDISDSMFRGDNIHNFYPLKDLSQSSTRNSSVETLLNKIVMKLDKLNRKNTPQSIRPFLNSIIMSNPLIANETIGSLCSISTNQSQDKNSIISSALKVKPIVPKLDFLDELSYQVQSALDATLERQNLEIKV